MTLKNSRNNVPLIGCTNKGVGFGVGVSVGYL